VKIRTSEPKETQSLRSHATTEFDAPGTSLGHRTVSPSRRAASRHVGASGGSGGTREMESISTPPGGDGRWNPAWVASSSDGKHRSGRMSAVGFAESLGA